MNVFFMVVFFLFLEKGMGPSIVSLQIFTAGVLLFVVIISSARDPFLRFCGAGKWDIVLEVSTGHV